MAVNIIVMDNDENFISFLDPDLLDLKEIFQDGLRSIDVTFNIEDILDAQEYFKTGNKIWVSGDDNITPCLYVLNTKIKRDLFLDSKYSFTAEEVLVELNYAPYINQIDITLANGFSGVTGKVVIDYNALKYWFGAYFNIGVVQDCISEYAGSIPFSGTMSPMALLRYIEDETGNVFVTRYEKDVLNNTIHRYLDFLNPANENKDWEHHFEYDFLEQSTTQIFDEDGEITTDDTEDVYEEDDVADFATNAPVVNINPTYLKFRITDGKSVLNTNGGIYDESDTSQIPLVWNAIDVGLTSQSGNVIISMKYDGSKIGLKVQNKSFTIYDDETLTGISGNGFLQNTVWNAGDFKNNVSLRSGFFFEFYDTNLSRVIYQHKIDAILSTAHEEILSFTRNVENVEFEVDESDTFSAIAPVLSVDKNSGASNGISHYDMAKILKAWSNLVINKGDIIPMIVQRMTVTGTQNNPCTQRTGHPSTGRSAEEILGGTSIISSRYYDRPIKPNDNTEGDNKSYEYWVGTAYWAAPFNKNKGEIHVEVDTNNSLEYPDIKGRPDSRDSRAIHNTPKIGPVETSEENIYAIYNAVAMKLKEKRDPVFNITTDVANLRENQYNNYNVHDLVYLKLPGFERLVTAEVVKTVKDLHNIAQNEVTLANYDVNTREITTDTYIDASNISFKYPSSKKLTVTLKNSNDDNDKLANKLITFTLYKMDNGSATLTRKIYTKKTNSQGKATITLKYNPGQYIMDIQFGGDAKYSECSMSIDISVGGTKEVSTKNTKNSTKSKTAKYKTVKTYYDKYGRSPDKKTIMAIGLPSRDSELHKYGYRFMKTTFKNHCPVCGRDGTLHWGWNFGTYFRGKREQGSYEGIFVCSHCDADFSGINGENHNRTGKPKLDRLTKPVKSSKAEAQKLIQGKIQYGTKKVKVKEKNVTDSKRRTAPIGTVNSYVKKKAISIVGNSVGVAAAKKIAAWMGKNIKYADYCNFSRSAKTVLQKGSGNCCDQARCMLELMDAAGCANEIKMQYIFVCCNGSGIGHVFTKITTNATGKWRYVDPCKANPWGNYVRGWGSPSSPRRITNYPSKPF